MYHDTDLVSYIQKSELSKSKKKDCTQNCTDCCAPCTFFCRIVCPCLKFYTVKTFVVLICCMILSYTMISSGFLSGVMSSLQRQFNLSTSKIGLVLASFDIMSVFAVPIVSYFGAKTNRPRLIALCSIAWLLGTGTFTIPYFLGNKYVFQDTSSQNKTLEAELNELCRYDLNETNVTTINKELNCERTLSDSWPYYAFIAGQLLMSFGVAPTFSLGVTYICDNSEERSHALFTSKCCN